MSFEFEFGWSDLGGGGGRPQPQVSNFRHGSTERDVDDQGVIVRFADHTAQVIYTGRSEKFPIQ